ncbi:MAG: glycosyltransferase family 2 protein [Brevinema sp.]
MSESLISIIIPVYNTELYLPKCLDSIVNQTLKNIEIIVVDDGSSGNCKEICKNYPQVKYLSYGTNKGLFFAREFGVRNAKADYILHVDSDDWIDLKLCEQLIGAIRPKVDLVLFNMLSIRPEGLEKGIWTNKGFQNFENLECFKALCSRELSSWTVAGKLLSRNLSLRIYELLNIDQHLIMGEDLLFFSYYSYFVKRTIYMPINGYYYNLTNQSVNRTAYTLDKALAHLSNLGLITHKLSTFTTQERLEDNTFDKIKKELLQGYLIQLSPLVAQDLEVISPRLNNIFALQLIELSIQQASLNQNVFRVKLDKFFSKIFASDGWFYKTLRSMIFFIINNKK